MSANILILLVNYKNEAEMLDFAASLVQLNHEIKICIINNSPENKITDARFQIVSAERNLGYFGAANFGLKKYLENDVMPDFIIISNSDMKIEDKNYFQQLIDLHTNSNADIVAPNIFTAKNLVQQNPYYTKRILENQLKRILFFTQNALLYWFYVSLSLLKRKTKNFILEPQEIYAAHGSHLIFKKSFFKKGGTLDYPSFLYAEELFVAEQVFQKKMKIIFEPKLKIIHSEHATTGLFKNSQQVKYLHQSVQFILKNFFSQHSK